MIAALISASLLLTSCGSGVWRPGRIGDLSSGSHALVISGDRAYELEEVRVADSNLFGRVVSVWIPTQIDGPYLEETDDHLRRGDSPTTIATVLKWQRTTAPEGSFAISITEVRFVRLYDPKIGTRAVQTAGGAVVAFLGVVFVGILLLIAVNPKLG